MFSIFLENMKRLSIFVVISHTILHFGVSPKYEKYVKLILSFIVVAQLVFSIGSYLNSKPGIVKWVSEENYYVKWNQYMEELETEYEAMQKVLDDKMMQNKNENTKENKDKMESIVVDKIEIKTGN